jgi:flavodoxin
MNTTHNRLYEGKTLVAYFSYSGNTRGIASQINNLIGGDKFEILPVNGYPDNYNDVLDRAKKEIRSGDKPDLKEKLTNDEYYDIIFIGYPNWWNTYPAPVSTFLSKYNLDGKTIIPFCTHGGGGIGTSIKNIKKQCPSSVVLDGFSINGYAVSENNPEVTNWIKSIKL